jgi:hypothetical protein
MGIESGVKSAARRIKGVQHKVGILAASFRCRSTCYDPPRFEQVRIAHAH